MNGFEYEYVDGQFFKKIKTLSKGRSFGELALQRRCTRTANVKTETDCEFAYITKEGFKESIMTIAEELEQSRINFLKALPIFSDFSRARVQHLLWEMARVKYTHTEVVFAEGEPVKYIFIVTKGVFELQ